MDKLIDLMNKLDKTSSTNEMKNLFIDFFKCTGSKEELYTYLNFLSNTFLPEPSMLNVGEATIISTISDMTGISKDDIKKKKKLYGNLSEAVEYCFINKSSNNTSLDSFFCENEESNEKLTLQEILEEIKILSTKSLYEEKINILQKIYKNQTPETTKYLTHFILGNKDLSIGYKNKLLLNALAVYFNQSIDNIMFYYTFTNSIPEIVYTDFDKNMYMLMHFPYKPQLATKTDKPVIPHGQHIDYKFDGGRIQIHADKNKISFFTRNIEDVTISFPDVYKPLQEWIKETGHEVILDSEFIVGNNFNNFLNRIRRKHNVEEYAKELPAIPHVFDILYIDGVDVWRFKLSERRKFLKSLELPENFVNVDYEIFTDQSQLDRLYEKAVKEGFEGVMVKEDVPYELNNRSESWIKIKPSYSVDLKIVDANLGNGRRANKYSSFLLATEEGLTIGNVGTGLTDQLIDELNSLYPKEIILEIEYESVQKTDKTTSGYSLRFPRVKSIRYDKTDVSPLNEVLKGVNIT